MSVNPLRLLLSGYAIALAAGLALHAAGAGAVAVALTVWVGGAALVLALGAVSRPGGWLTPAKGDDAEDAALYAEAARRWEEDRRADAAAAHAAAHADADRAAAARSANR